MTRLFALIFALLWPALAVAQDYPSYDNIWVNDQANVLSDDAEARVTEQLQGLADETGVQATVLTLQTRWGYGGASIEDFATGLFNHWGIGDAERNDGILVLVVPTDREMRIELGEGYPAGFDEVADQIIKEDFVPAFGRDDFEGGIETGVQSVVNRIARAHAGVPAPKSDPSASGGGVGLGVVGGIFAVLIGWLAFGRRIADRFRKCPNCGARGVHTSTTVLTPATRDETGQGRRTVSCPHCGSEHNTNYTINKKRSSSSGRSFGGGSSSGGGASGRW